MVDDNALVKVEATGPSLSFSFSKALPTLFARVFTPRMFLSRQVDEGITRQIVSKVTQDEPLDDAELQFATMYFGDEAVRYIHLKRVIGRGAVVLPALRARVDSEPKKPAGETPRDWVNKFRDDASLVDDVMLQEAYGRVLAQEACAPGSVSLATLRVLRYLDREVADTFARVLQLVCVDALVPADASFYRMVGVNHSDWVSLTDAGLLAGEDSNFSPHTDDRPRLDLTFRLLGWAFTFEETVKGDPPNFDVRLLTRAGQDLARVVDGPVGEETLSALGKWFKSGARGAKVGIYKGTPTMPEGPWEAL